MTLDVNYLKHAECLPGFNVSRLIHTKTLKQQKTNYISFIWRNLRHSVISLLFDGCEIGSTRLGPTRVDFVIVTPAFLYERSPA